VAKVKGSEEKKGWRENAPTKYISDHSLNKTVAFLSAPQANSFQI